MNKVFNKKTIPYWCLLVMALVCYYFGSKKLFTIVGFKAIVIVFAIAIVLSFILKGPLSEASGKDDDDDDGK